MLAAILLELFEFSYIIIKADFMVNRLSGDEEAI